MIKIKSELNKKKLFITSFYCDIIAEDVRI